MDWAERNGWIARRLQWINRNAAPDVLFSRDNVTILVEFKRPNGELDPQQERERKRFAACGTTIFKVDDIAQGLALLEKLHMQRPRNAR